VCSYSADVELPVCGEEEIGDAATGLPRTREGESAAGAEHQVALIIPLMAQFSQVGIPLTHHDAVQATRAINGRPSVTLRAECQHSRRRDNTKRPRH